MVFFCLLFSKGKEKFAAAPKIFFSGSCWEAVRWLATRAAGMIYTQACLYPDRGIKNVFLECYMKLVSSAFRDKGIIPSRYTCEGTNISPPLEISNVPQNAKSLVLVMDDPDVPGYVRSECVWDHWIIFNMSPATRQIPEMTGPSSGTHGKTTFDHTGYGGPCPPDREHRYFFKLYALDILLPLKEGATKKEIEKAMEGHIVAETRLMGRYEKNRGY